MARLGELLAIRLPIVQAPMAGLSAPALAAGPVERPRARSIAVGAAEIGATRQIIRDVSAR